VFVAAGALVFFSFILLLALVAAERVYIITLEMNATAK
jgi:hypothetical protein